MDFQDFDLHPVIMANVARAGYSAPTLIQQRAIPPVSKGRDIMGLAQTGTGKTAAFVLPMLNRFMTGKRKRIRSLIISPTRELAEQTHQNIINLGRSTGLRSVSIYGGVGIHPQFTQLRRGPEFVVACPGRLLDHIQRKTVNLSHLEVLVIDEADLMFDMGFFPDIRKIMGHLPKQRQTLLFSATMPDEIQKLAKDVLVDPLLVQVGTTAPADTVSHALYPVSPQRKTALLKEILRRTDTGSVLVFTRTKYRAKNLGEQLSKAGYNSASLQGNLSQTRRQAALDGFRSGQYQVLVATDIAARGIDVSRVSHVINYDIPNTPDAYIHRIGRTGRAARTGDAFTLVTDEDRGMVRAITRILGAPIEQKYLEGFDYTSRNVPRERRARPPRKPAPGVSATPAWDAPHNLEARQGQTAQPKKARPKRKTRKTGPKANQGPGVGVKRSRRPRRSGRPRTAKP